MRTTLVIADPVFKRAKTLAKRKHCPLSKLVTEALEVRLAREEHVVREGRAEYVVKSEKMGAPKVDINDRNALFEAME